MPVHRRRFRIEEAISGDIQMPPEVDTEVGPMHREIMSELRAAGAEANVRVVMGGIIPSTDLPKLEAIGVARVFTPSDYDVMDIMEAIVDLLETPST